MFNLNNSVVIVTGGNNGIGLAIANGLVNHSAKVVRVDKFFNTKLNSEDYILDLNDHKKIPKLVKEIFHKYGKIDGLVNAAGVSFSSENPYLDETIFDSTLSVNLKAIFILCSSVCSFMAIKNFGSIVNITSLGANLAFPNNPAYQISKAGLAQLTRSFARDWVDKGIRINNISPGYIKTSMTEKSFLDPILNAERLNRMIIKRWGDPEDLIGPAIFLLSEASKYITASDISVDGGWASKGL